MVFFRWLCDAYIYVSSTRWHGRGQDLQTWSDQSALYYFEQNKNSPLVIKEQRKSFNIQSSSVFVL